MIAKLALVISCLCIILFSKMNSKLYRKFLVF